MEKTSPVSCYVTFANERCIHASSIRMYATHQQEGLVYTLHTSVRQFVLLGGSFFVLIYNDFESDVKLVDWLRTKKYGHEDDRFWTTRKL